MKRLSLFALAAMGVFVAMPASADKWDQANCAPPSVGCNDSCATCTTNELVHGSSQVHDLDDISAGTAPDEDWYFISLKPNTSYEVVVDGTTPYINQANPVSLTLNDAAGTVDTTDYAISSRGFSRSLRVGNSTTTVNDDRWVRVLAQDCGTTACFDIDEYHISMRETTYYVPRFNNSGTQTTVLIIQNPTDSSVSGNIYYWNPAGALLATSTLSLNAKSTSVIQTQNTVPGVGGSVTLSHNSTYGALSGKAVALEPATGFTFDTLMVPRVN